MTNPTDSTNITPPPPTLVEKSKEKLKEFFQDRRIKSLLVNVLVPGTLAAALFPIFGPAVAGVAAFVAVKNGLDLLGVKFSDDTIKKLMKPLEGQQLDENDMQDVLQATLAEVLPADKQVNDEAAKALVKIAPTVKEVALTNPKLDATWLGTNLETNLKAQGGAMAMVAPKVNELVQLDDAQLRETARDMLANWSQVIQTITVSGSAEVSNSPQNVKGRGGNISQNISATDQGKVTGSSQSVDLT